MDGGDGVSETWITRYTQAAKAISAGRFDFEIPPGAPAEFAGLGESLNELAEEMRVRSDRATKLAEINRRINEGLVLEDVLDHVEGLASFAAPTSTSR